MEMQAFTLVDESSGSKLRVSLFGATVISWTVRGRERLFLSDKAVLNGSKAIRGGIPPVFPVFGKAQSGPCASLPQHGFARNTLWQIETKETDSAVLSLSPDDLSEEFRRAWPYAFKLHYHLRVHGSTLTTRLCIENSGAQSFDFQTLLHTYFRVKDIAKTHVRGLTDITYRDKVTATEIKEQATEVSCTSETDRVYPNVQNDVAIYEDDEVSLEIKRQGLDDIVLWNPWTGCEKMGDFAPVDGYKRMICVETGAVGTWHTLRAGATHVAEQVITARL